MRLTTIIRTGLSVSSTSKCVILTVLKKDGNLFLVRAEDGPNHLLDDIETQATGMDMHEDIVVQVPPSIDISSLVPCSYGGAVNLTLKPVNKEIPSV